MRRTFLISAALLALVSAGSLAGGCYHKTISSNGYGPDNKIIEEPNMGTADRVLGYPQSNYKSLPTTH